MVLKAEEKSANKNSRVSLRPLKMPVQGVQDEQLGIINTPPRSVSKLKRIWVTLSDS